MKIAVCVEATPSPAALGATALALAIDGAEVCWVHAGIHPFYDKAVPVGVGSVITVAAPELAQPHSQSLAQVLATAVQTLGCNLAFCGVLSNGAGTGILGAALAVAWDVPFVSQVHAVSLRGSHLHVRVHGGTAVTTVAVPWPSVIACVPPSVPLPIQKQPLASQVLTLADLGLATASIRRSGESRSEPLAISPIRNVNSSTGLQRALLGRSR